MFPNDYRRPANLYLYAERALLERALKGQFVLQAQGSGKAACLALSFSQSFSPEMFQLFGQADSCLVIHKSEQFGERLHAAVQKLLPSWVGIDGAVQYGKTSPLGALFTRPAAHAREAEWLFAWRPGQAGSGQLHTVQLDMGSIAQWAELRERDCSGQSTGM